MDEKFKRRFTSNTAESKERRIDLEKSSATLYTERSCEKGRKKESARRRRADFYVE